MSSADEVLVTGAAGFIGRHLVRRLAEDGARVTAVDVEESPPSFASERIRYDRCDVRDTAKLEELLSEDGDVYHLASVHLEVGKDESAFEAVNVRAARDLVEACEVAGVRRLIHTSSVGIYGHVEDVPAREDSPKRPETPYERTKLVGERAVRDRAEEMDVELVVLRPAWVYGPGCRRTDKLTGALRTGRFFYIGKGDNLRHPLYIEDMLNAFLLAAEAPSDLSGNSYLVGGPRYMTLREMVDTFAGVMGVSPPRIHIPKPVGWGMGLAMEGLFTFSGSEPPFSRRSLAFFQNDNAFDISAARRDLGFDPVVDLEEGVARTLEGTVQREVAA